MKKYYLTVSIFIAVIMVLILTLLTWAELPTVAKTESGQCAYIEQHPEFTRKPCPLVLPLKYNLIFVPSVISLRVEL